MLRQLTLMTMMMILALPFLYFLSTSFLTYCALEYLQSQNQLKYLFEIREFLSSHSFWFLLAKYTGDYLPMMNDNLPSFCVSCIAGIPQLDLTPLQPCWGGRS